MSVSMDDHERLRQRFLTGELVEQLQRFAVLSQEEAEALGLALADIAEEVATIYRDILPRLEQAPTADAFRDALVDLALALRHIDYHLHDTRVLDPA